MTRLIYALPAALSDKTSLTYPGMAKFLPFLDLYGMWVLPADRTGTLQTPVRTDVQFPIPKFRKFTTSYADLCDTRAKEVLADAERLGATMYVLYSGGIDSTCILVSLLKNATAAQKANIIVLLSHESITENPRFYEEHIRGKLKVGSSITFPEHIGEDAYLLSAEHNDMVLGSDKIGKLMLRFGPDSIRKPYDRTMLAEFFAASLGNDRALAEFSLDLFERLRDIAPIPIRNNMEFLWWLNFCIKWQACFYFMLLFTPPKNAPRVNATYISERFISFFNTDEFQLWSMNNPDLRIKDTWKSYKWVAKDIIYEYTKDAQYRDHKTKKGSLLPLLGYTAPIRFIDEQMHFRNNIAPEEYLQDKNDFV